MTLAANNPFSGHKHWQQQAIKQIHPIGVQSDEFVFAAGFIEPLVIAGVKP